MENNLIKALVADLAEQMRPMLADMVRPMVANMVQSHLDRAAEITALQTIDYEELAQSLDMASYARVAESLGALQLDDIACNIPLDDLAQEIDLDKLAGAIDLESALTEYFQNNTFTLRHEGAV
jgi:hypothetical protein